MLQTLDPSSEIGAREFHHSPLAILEAVFEQVVSSSAPARERTEGAAFLRAAKDLYGVSRVTYFCINIPLRDRDAFAHCLYSDSAVRHVCGTRFSDPRMLAALRRVIDREEKVAGSSLETVLPLGQQQDEIALLGIGLPDLTSDDQEPDRAGRRLNVLRELRILGNYLHGHNLRINGYDWESQTIVSARELDCLKWVAAGKTAWEASVILGISERTVRFHLNAAREKLNCATTTQAVAKAVASRMIEL